jgi:hypothetical protein
MSTTTQINGSVQRLLQDQLLIDPNKLEAAVDTKAQRAKISKSDYAWPDADGGPKFPITTQAQVMSASRLLGRAKTDDATKARIKSRIKSIANRKGFDLPKAWAGDSKSTKKKGEATATMSDDMVRSALSDALRLDPDPDGDGDDDRDNDPYGMDMCWCYVADVYDDYFVYSFHDKDDGEDSGLYKRSYSIDANDEAVLGGDVSRVIRRVTYDPYVEEPGTESIRESTTLFEVDSAFTITAFEAGTDGLKGKITGTAIKPGFNKSRQRYYPKETLAASVESLVSKKMYIDHPSTIDDRTRPERSIKDQAAIITNAWVQPDGGIGYEATIYDAWLDERVSLMAERGVLSALATSVNYQGVQESAVIEGERTNRIDEMAYNSLDFVTEAGAWGDVAHLESAAAAAQNSGTTAEETEEMADDKVLAAMQERLDELTKQNTTLIESFNSEAAARRKSDAKIAVKDLLAESVLPEVAQKKIVAEWDGKESVDGLADRIASEITFIEELTGKKLEAKGAETTGVEAEREKIRRQRTGAPKRIVVENGGSSEANRPAPPKVEAVGGWALGKNAKTFEEKFVTG